MIINKVTFEGKFAVTTNFLDETIGAEATLEEGETLEDGIIKLRERIRNVVKSYNTNNPSQQYFDNAIPVIQVKDR